MPPNRQFSTFSLLIQDPRQLSIQLQHYRITPCSGLGAPVLLPLHLRLRVLGHVSIQQAVGCIPVQRGNVQSWIQNLRLIRWKIN
jgi:hypothetical protein